MPQRGNWKTIQIRADIKEKFMQAHEADKNRPENLSFSAYMDNIFRNLVNYRDNLEKYGPLIEVDGIHGNRISLYDHKINKNVTIFINIKTNKLDCEFHNNSDCLHIGFVLAQPEIYNRLIENGFKPIVK